MGNSLTSINDPFSNRNDPSSSIPGAFRQFSQPRGQRYTIQVPKGVYPGEKFLVDVQDQRLLVECPETARQGDEITVITPSARSLSKNYLITVPYHIKQTTKFHTNIDGEDIEITVPDGIHPGDQITFQLTKKEKSKRETEKYHQLYEIVVPDGVEPGQSFSLVADGHRILVTCPLKAKSGSRIRFQLPIQLSTSELEAANVKYSQDRWMRCLGADLKFHWIYNKQKKDSKLNKHKNNSIEGEDFEGKSEEKEGISRREETLEEKRNKIFNIDEKSFIRVLSKKSLFFPHSHRSSPSSSSPSNNTLDPSLTLDPHLTHTMSPSEIEQLEQNLLSSLDPSAILMNGKFVFSFIPAVDFSIRAAVKGTSIGHEEISAITSATSTSSTSDSSSLDRKMDFLRNTFSELRVPWEEGHVRIRVRRTHLLVDTLNAFLSIEKNDLRKIFRYEFIGEPALDAGGVTREFYSLVSEAICHPDHGLFSFSSVNQMCMQINPNSELINEKFHLQYFHVFGRILGKAFMDAQITPVHFVQPFYKYLLGWPISLSDLEHIDDQIYRNLIELMDFEDVSILMLDFTITEDKLGITKTIDLLPDGSDILVTAENLPCYLEEQLKYRLFKRISKQLFSLLYGFYEIVPETLMSVLDYQELELILHGLPNIDMNDWQKNTEYSGEFTVNPEHHVIAWFWEIVSEMDHTTKAKLLQFVTGTSGVPSQGFAFLQGTDGNIRKFTLHGDKNVHVFPRAHTCFNRIDLPLYPLKTEMKKFLLLAISLESSGFGIE